MTTCPYCKRLFNKTREWQKTCGKERCLIKHKAKLSHDWRVEHPNYHRRYMVQYRVVVMKGVIK